MYPQPPQQYMNFPPGPRELALCNYEKPETDFFIFVEGMYPQGIAARKLQLEGLDSLFHNL